MGTKGTVAAVAAAPAAVFVDVALAVAFDDVAESVAERPANSEQEIEPVPSPQD